MIAKWRKLSITMNRSTVIRNYIKATSWHYKKVLNMELKALGSYYGPATLQPYDNNQAVLSLTPQSEDHFYFMGCCD